MAISRVALDDAVAFARHLKAVIIIHVLELPHPAREAEAETSLPSLTRRDASRDASTPPSPPVNDGRWGLVRRRLHGANPAQTASLIG